MPIMMMMMIMIMIEIGNKSEKRIAIKPNCKHDKASAIAKGAAK